jgi:hypothetical protein
MIGLPITLALLFGTIFLIHMWIYIPAIYHAIRKPGLKFVLIVEPSPFRLNESYVVGPYNPAKAIWISRRIASRNPYTEIRVGSAACIVVRGTRILYDGRTGYNATTPVWS